MVTIHEVGKTEWSVPSVKQLANMEGISIYEAKKMAKLLSKGTVWSKVKSPKREMKTLRILKKIVDSLPCTFSVLRRKTKFSKPTLSRYLAKLTTLPVNTKPDPRVKDAKGKVLPPLTLVRKERDPKTELDIYYLNDMIRMINDPFYGVGGVLDQWYSTPDYSISRALRKNSKVKLAMAGKKVKIKP